VRGSGLFTSGACGYLVALQFTDSAGATFRLGGFKSLDGSFKVAREVPVAAAPGPGAFIARPIRKRQLPPGGVWFCAKAGVYFGSFKVTASAVPQFDPPTLRVRPHTGPGGTVVRIRGAGFAGHTATMCLGVFVIFTDAETVTTSIGSKALA